MKSTGIVRKVDPLGRIVLPKELRNVLDIQEGTPVEIFTEDNKIILRKFESSKACIITGVISDDNVTIAGKVFSLKGMQQVAKVLVEK